MLFLDMRDSTKSAIAVASDRSIMTCSNGTDETRRSKHCA